jgi:hypothetical protein
MEIWKDIVGYEGLYQVSNLGNVKSCNFHREKREKLLNPDVDKLGYKRVRLYHNSKSKKFQIHRLVALMFIPNPENKPFINHIDCNPSNNRVDNLEWVTPKENIQYASDLGRLKGSRHTPIIATNLSTSKETYFSSQCEAARQLNLNSSHINQVLKGNRKQTGGYTFKYLKED